MNILVTNHQMMDYSGSDVFTSILADFLGRRGHSVTVYSRYLGRIASELSSLQVRVVDDLAKIDKEEFDIAHVHHNINAVEIRYHFPRIPIVFLSHGVLPFLERPPLIDIDISVFLAVSEEVGEHLKLSANCPEKVKLFRNIIDSRRFCQHTPVHTRPEKVLVLSNNMDKEHEEIIRLACDDLNIQYQFAGQSYGMIEQDRLPLEMNEVDVVFSLGRGAMEAMMCGRVPIVYDYRGGDGIVTPENFHELKKCNFSGRTFKKDFTVQELKDEIRKYDPSFAPALKDLALAEFDADHRINDLLEIYTEAIENPSSSRNSELDFRLIEYFALSLRETRRYFGVASDEAIADIRKACIETLQSGAGWKLLLKYYRIRDYFIEIARHAK